MQRCLSLDLEVLLPVRVLGSSEEEERMIEVPLERNTTADDVIRVCLEQLASTDSAASHADLAGSCADWWALVADFQGFEKRFSTEERLYQLIRKHVLLAGNTEGVRFYLRKKKKRFSICSLIDQPTFSNASEFGFDNSELDLHRSAHRSRVSGHCSDVDSGLDHYRTQHRHYRQLLTKSVDRMMPLAEMHPMRVPQPPPVSAMPPHIPLADYAMGQTRHPMQTASSQMGQYRPPPQHHQPRTAGNNNTGVASTASNRPAYFTPQTQPRQHNSELPLVGSPLLPGYHQRQNPQQPSNGGQQLVAGSAKTYNELLQMADRQRRQMDANRLVIQQKEARLKAVRTQQQMQQSQNQSAARHRLQELKQEIAKDEQEVSGLRKLQVEIDRNNNQTQGHRSELDTLQQVFSSKERELRDAVGKVETLREQLDELQRRRESARAAALAMSARVRLEDAAPPPPPSVPPPAPTTSAAQTPTCRVAAVEPFNMMPQKPSPELFKKPILPADTAATQAPQPNSFISSKGYDTVLRTVTEALERQAHLDKSPSAHRKDVTVTITETPTSRATANVTLSKPFGSSFDDSGSSSSSISQSPTAATSTQDAPVQQTSTSVSLCASSSSKQQHTKRTGGADATDSAGALHRRRTLDADAAQALARDAPPTAPTQQQPPDLIPARDRLAPSLAALAVDGNDGAVRRPIETDVLHIRSDNLRAAKRRSWAEQPGGETATTTTNDETTHIRLLLKKEQQRGRSHINFGFIFKELDHAQHHAGGASPPGEGTTPPAHPPQASNKQPLGQLQEDEPEIRPPPPYQQPTLTPPNTLAVPPPPYSAVAKQPSPQDTSSSEGSDLDNRAVISVIEVDPDSRRSLPKGILREPRSRNNRPEGERNIRFDPLALLLDAALEGELDLVMESANLMGDVSVSNNEGITALHNAICAGHYDIVRLLIDKDADVNAQDSDGWTPLHCAASCNNVLVVKFLVRHGACVFATTLSDHETAADKCEENEDGFDACSRFLIYVQEQMGRVDGGRVFAAYDYDALHADELSVRAGDAVTVVDRDSDAEKGWWWCRHEDTTGYLPRNYLAQYPRLADQRRHNYPLVDLASPPASDASATSLEMMLLGGKEINNNVNNVLLD